MTSLAEEVVAAGNDTARTKHQYGGDNSLVKAVGEAGSMAWDIVSGRLDAPLNSIQGFLKEGPVGAAKGFAQREDYDYKDPDGTTTMPVYTGTEEGFSVPMELQRGDTGEVPNQLINTLLELPSDPLNYVGAGMVAKGNKMLDAAGVSRGYEGMLMSNPSNFLNNYYNPGHIPPTLLEDLVSGPAGAVSEKGAQYTKTIAGKRRIQGAVESLVQGGFRGVLDMFNPTARANWKQGISANSQRLVAKTIDRHEGLTPILEGGAKKSKVPLKVNPEYPVPYWRQPKFDKLWDNKEWRVGYLKDKHTLYNQAIDEGFAQIVYNSHMIDQSGMTVPKFHEAMAEARKRMFLEPATLNENGTITALLKDNAGSVRTTGYEYVRNAAGEFKTHPVKVPGTDLPNPKAGKRIRRGKIKPREQSIDEAKYIENHVLAHQKMPAGKGSIVVKPQAGVSGHHFNDVVYSNPANGAQVDLMKKNWNEFNQTGQVPMDKFQKHWEEAAANQTSDNKYHILDFDEDGVWITGGKTGRSIVEGGVNFITKFRNDGTTMSVMSDKHDFLEKMPVVGKLIEKFLPHDLVAITPAMESDIFRIKPTSFTDAKYGLNKGAVGSRQRRKTQPTKIPQKVPAAIQKDDRTYAELLMDYATAKPQQDVLNAERMKVGGLVATPTAPIVNQNTDG